MEVVKEFSGKTLLITGGTGSFGNAVLRRFLKTNIKEIRIFSRDELKQDDMRRFYQNDKIKYYLGNVQDFQSVINSMHGVDYVFHAAALKQVPSCEFFPIEAVNTNIIGTENVLRAAIDEKVSTVICLSTDKAAYPVNAMGISKAMMEKVIIAKSRTTTTTKICCTRYGNVIFSRGSVLPLWIKQIKNGEQLTITDPKMTRFIMSLDEAVDLVVFAFLNGNNGDILVQKTSATTIEVLAEALKRLFKYEKENKIIGLRHGEKTYETLLTDEESFHAIDMGGFFSCPSDKRDLNYEKFLDYGTPRSGLQQFNSNNTILLSIEDTMKKLMTIKEIREEVEMWNKSKL